MQRERIDGRRADGSGARRVRVGDRVAVLRDARFRIRAYAGGPLLVTGADQIQESDGTRVACERATVALCRCGRSRLGTFCDGTHRFVPS